MISRKKLKKINRVVGFTLLTTCFLLIYSIGDFVISNPLWILWFTSVMLGLHMLLDNIKLFNSDRFFSWLYWRWIRKTWKTEKPKRIVIDKDDITFKLILVGLGALSFGIATFFDLFFFMIGQYTGGWNLFREPVFWLSDIGMSILIFFFIIFYFGGGFD